MPIDNPGPIDLSTCVIDLDRNNRSTVRATKPGPPERIDGYTIGAPRVEGASPHDGEMHPDGEEILFLVSGRITVLLEDAEPARAVTLGPGETLVVPRGVWHKIEVDEPGQLIHVTPGPSGDFRPLPR